MTASLIGDGIFLVTLAWQVYELSNAPTALSIVGVAMTVPQIVFLLVGGVVSDRFDRRRVMIAADALRAVSVAVLGVLSITGNLELWHILIVAAILRRRHRVLRAGLRRDRPAARPERRPEPGQLAGPVHPPGRRAHDRPRDRRVGSSPCGAAIRDRRS